MAVDLPRVLPVLSCWSCCAVSCCAFHSPSKPVEMRWHTHNYTYTYTHNIIIIHSQLSGWSQCHEVQGACHFADHHPSHRHGRGEGVSCDHWLVPPPPPPPPLLTQCHWLWHHLVCAVLKLRRQVSAMMGSQECCLHGREWGTGACVERGRCVCVCVCACVQEREVYLFNINPFNEDTSSLISRRDC